MPSSRRRGWLFALLAAGCLAASAIAVATAVRDASPVERSSRAATELLAGERDGAQAIVVRDLREDARGAIAVAASDDPERLEPTSLRCDRVHFGGGAGLCLAPGGGFASGYRARIFGPDMRVRGEVAVEGIPSRARVSPDGRRGAVTMFVTGHSYAEAGEFSTQTTLIDLRRGTKLGDLEQFTVTDGDRQVTAVDMNFWGVTFADDGDRFYATLATGGRTHLIEGSVRRRTAHVLRDNVECPSLSPDGTRVAFKKRVESDDFDGWRLTVLDLETLRETPLAETRSVDDQVEWLDDRRILYAVDRSVLVLPADGSGAPRRFVGSAVSPAVPRQP